MVKEINRSAENEFLSKKDKARQFLAEHKGKGIHNKKQFKFTERKLPKTLSKPQN